MLRIVICDDEKACIDKIDKKVKKWSREQKIEAEVHSTSSGEEVLEVVERGNSTGEFFDVILLDIQMDGLDGMETAQRIRAMEPRTYIIFVTALFTGSLVADAFDVRAFQYIVKDDLPRTLPAALNSLVKDLKARSITVVVNRREVDLALADILYFEIDKRITAARMIRGRIVRFYMQVLELEEHLEGKGFIRCHRSFLVNGKQIRSVTSHRAIMSDYSEIPVGRSYYDQVYGEWRTQVMGEVIP